MDVASRGELKRAEPHCETVDQYARMASEKFRLL